MEKVKYMLLTLFLAVTMQAAVVDTVNVRSRAMQKEVQVVVIAPERKTLPGRTIYLLHGYSGNAKSWIGIKPGLTALADKYNVLFVCPNAQNSWYWDSPKDPAFRYETFVSSELTDYIDTHYNTLKKREARAITGLSMGGHGALWIAFRHPDVFGAAGSTSGGVDIRPFPKNWEMSKLLGDYEQNREIWDSHTVINQIDRIRNDQLAIIIDCGYDDFFFEVNNNFHQKLLDHNINHDYLTRPGGHDSKYWNNSIDYQVLFFTKYFDLN